MIKNKNCHLKTLEIKANGDIILHRVKKLYEKISDYLSKSLSKFKPIFTPRFHQELVTEEFLYKLEKNKGFFKKYFLSNIIYEENYFFIIFYTLL